MVPPVQLHPGLAVGRATPSAAQNWKASASRPSLPKSNKSPRRFRDRNHPRHNRGSNAGLCASLGLTHRLDCINSSITSQSRFQFPSFSLSETPCAYLSRRLGQPTDLFVFPPSLSVSLPTATSRDRSICSPSARAHPRRAVQSVRPPSRKLICPRASASRRLAMRRRRSRPPARPPTSRWPRAEAPTAPRPRAPPARVAPPPPPPAPARTPTAAARRCPSPRAAPTTRRPPASPSSSTSPAPSSRC